jgi:CDGSH-type Zn-finger protein
MTPVKITVRTNGSLRVEGDFEIYDMEGGRFDLAGRKAISLCRCGLSKDKPFCDSSHKNGAFISEVKAKALPPPATA